MDSKWNVQWSLLVETETAPRAISLYETKSLSVFSSILNIPLQCVKCANVPIMPAITASHYRAKNMPHELWETMTVASSLSLTHTHTHTHTRAWTHTCSLSLSLSLSLSFSLRAGGCYDSLSPPLPAESCALQRRERKREKNKPIPSACQSTVTIWMSQYAGLAAFWIGPLAVMLESKCGAVIKQGKHTNPLVTPSLLLTICL